MERVSALESVVVETGPDPRAAVIWLHGLGADGHDFEPIVPYLELPSELPVRFVFPHASIRPVTINGGMRMRAWYDISGYDLDRGQDEAGMRESARLVTGVLAAEVARGFAADRIVLAGFSQGGAIAAHVALRHPERLAGLMILSAYLPLADSLAQEASAANRAIPILQCHGTWDPVVPAEIGRRTAEFLRDQGYSVVWHGYPAEHSVHPAEITEIGRWLRAVLAPR